MSEIKNIETNRTKNSKEIVKISLTDKTNERTKYIRNRVKLLLDNPKVLPKYKNVLLRLYKKNAIYYTDESSAMATDRNGNKIIGNFFGTADLRTNRIRITGLAWESIQYRGEPSLEAEIDFILLHETNHLILKTTQHIDGYENFNKEIKDMNFWTYSEKQEI